MQTQPIERLIAVADAVLGQVQNGELFCHGKPDRVCTLSTGERLYVELAATAPI
jgi:hypothetical protein